MLAIEIILKPLSSTSKESPTNEREQIRERKRGMALLLSSASCYCCSCTNPKFSPSTATKLETQNPNPAPLQSSKQVKFVKSLAPPLMAAIFVLSPICNEPVSLGQTIDIQRGTTLFRQACIGCHDAGGNIIQPGATLFLKDLQRNGVDTEDEIYRVTYFGKGRMPGFGEKCTPRGQCTFGARLQDEDIKLLAQFVKSQADQGWPKIESMED